MKNIISNKFFLIGSLLLLLLAIPLTLFFISQQQELRSRAAPSSRLFFTPESTSTSTQCTSFAVDIMVDPGENIVSIVDFYLTYDPTTLDILEIKEGTAFPTVVRPVSITSGEANMSVSVGADVTKAVQSTAKVATVTFRPKAAQSALVQFDATRTRVFSLAPADEPTENVLSTTTPTNIGITSDACSDGGDGEEPAPTLPPGEEATPTPNPGTGGGTSPTPTTTAPSPTTTVQNQVPTCTDFTVSPQATGSAPFSVLFTAKGNDPNSGGLIAKTTFNFGDGQVQDVTEGMNLKDVTVQTNHTYQNAGVFAATVTFTDNAGAISQSCSETLTVTGASPSAVPSPTSTSSAPTAAPTLVEKPTAAPTLPPTGGVAQTVGIVGVLVLAIIGGFLLLAL